MPAPRSPLSYLWPRLPSPAPAEPIQVQPQLHTQRPLTCVRPPRCGPRWPSSNRDSFACSSVVPGQVYVPPINILPPFLPHAPYWDLLRPLRMTLTNQPKLPGPLSRAGQSSQEGPGAGTPHSPAEPHCSGYRLGTCGAGGRGRTGRDHLSRGEGSGPWTARARHGRDLKKERKARGAVITAPCCVPGSAFNTPLPNQRMPTEPHEGGSAILMQRNGVSEGVRLLVQGHRGQREDPGLPPRSA